MVHPLPLLHVTAEPWFRYLRTLTQPPYATRPSLKAPCRSLLEASVEIAESRRAYYDSLERQEQRMAEHNAMLGGV